MYDLESIELADNPYLAVDAPKRSLHYFELKNYNNIPPYGYLNPLNDSMARTLRHGYYASVSYVDALIGRLMDELKYLNMYEDTIITLASDHGYHLGEKGTWCKHSVYEETLHVPLIIKAPGYKPSRVPALVENIDIFPTVLELNEIPFPRHLQGKSLVSLMKDPTSHFKAPGSPDHAPPPPL